MTRTTIDFGIYLGSSYSQIAVMDGVQVSLIKNFENLESTPSAVWIDKKNRLSIGRVAKRCSEFEPEDAYTDFMLQMGTQAEYRFARSGRVMRPEDLTAEVLKSLRADVKQRLGEDLQAAVITVPATFGLAQCDATRRAAQLAGLALSPLIMEPVAAAIAYASQEVVDLAFYLIFHFHESTFEATVVKRQDKVFTVVNHAGDNHLGEKLLYWGIVETLLAPAVAKENRLQDFTRSNPKWRKVFTRLNREAEEALECLSTEESTTITVDFLENDDFGKPLELCYVLKKSDVVRLLSPLIDRTLNTCLQALGQSRLGFKDIDKIIYVGNPTMVPYIFQHLKEVDEGLEKKLDYRIDPRTVMVKGAAIFAGTYRLEKPAVPFPSNTYQIELESEPAVSRRDPVVRGKVISHQGEDLTGFTIEFINPDASPVWRSGKVSLSPRGAFSVGLKVLLGGMHKFRIELCDADDKMVATDPETINYILIEEPVPMLLTHSIGVALPNNEVSLFFEKGTTLPRRQRKDMQAPVTIHQGAAGEKINFPIVEVDETRADRNRLIGNISIRGEEVDRDIPAGTPIEITIQVDESRMLTCSAYVPLLNQEFEQVLHLEQATPDINLLTQELEKEKKRLQEARRKSQASQNAGALQILSSRVDGGRMIEIIEAALADARNGDLDAGDKAKHHLLDLKIVLDEIENCLEGKADGSKDALPGNPKIMARPERIGEKKDMERSTINFGIHLGSDYCVMAQMKNGQIDVINTPEGAVLTPTAVWLNRTNQFQAGKPAALQLDKDTENTAAGFISRLGAPDLYPFKRSGLSLSAEELGVEQFKALLRDAAQQTGAAILAAVVSTPTSFEDFQRQAVVRTARQAGLQQVVLLSELEAAVHAHTFTNLVAAGTWLVFYLGPYSFETAIIRKERDTVKILSARSDAAIGDRLITQAIVDHELAPAAGRDYSLNKFERSNPRWRKAFAKLDAVVETARARLASQRTYPITFDILCSDDDGEPVPFEHELKVSHVTQYTTPVLKRAVELSLQALAEANLKKKDIDCVLPIGETTLSPLVDAYLNHAQTGLGIPINFDGDPLTVAAQGAAVFASRCLLEMPEPAVVEAQPDKEGPAAVETIPEEASPVKGSESPAEQDRALTPQAPEPQQPVISGVPSVSPQVILTAEAPPPEPEPAAVDAVAAPEVFSQPAAIEEPPALEPEPAAVDVVAAPEVFSQPPIVEETPAPEPESTDVDAVAAPEVFSQPAIVEEAPALEPEPAAVDVIATPEVFSQPAIVEETPALEPEPAAADAVAAPEVFSQPAIVEEAPALEPESAAVDVVAAPEVFSQPAIVEETPALEPEPAVVDVVAAPEVFPQPAIVEEAPALEPEPAAVDVVAAPEVFSQPAIVEENPALDPEPVAFDEKVKPPISPRIFTFKEPPPVLPGNRQELKAWLLKSRTSISHVIESGQYLQDDAFEHRFEKILAEINQALADLAAHPD